MISTASNDIQKRVAYGGTMASKAFGEYIVCLSATFANHSKHASLNRWVLNMTWGMVQAISNIDRP